MVQRLCIHVGPFTHFLSQNSLLCKRSRVSHEKKPLNISQQHQSCLFACSVLPSVRSPRRFCLPDDLRGSAGSPDVLPPYSHLGYWLSAPTHHPGCPLLRKKKGQSSPGRYCVSVKNPHLILLQRIWFSRLPPLMVCPGKPVLIMISKKWHDVYWRVGHCVCYWCSEPTALSSPSGCCCLHSPDTKHFRIFSWVYRLPFYEYMYINVCVAWRRSFSYAILCCIMTNNSPWTFNLIIILPVSLRNF